MSLTLGVRAHDAHHERTQSPPSPEELSSAGEASPPVQEQQQPAAGPNAEIELHRRVLPIIETQDDCCSVCLDNYTQARSAVAAPGVHAPDSGAGSAYGNVLLCRRTLATRLPAGGSLLHCPNPASWLSVSTCRLQLLGSQAPGLRPVCAHRHCFHLQCIMQWAQRSRECPLCFKPLQLAVRDPASLASALHKCTCSCSGYSPVAGSRTERAAALWRVPSARALGRQRALRAHGPGRLGARAPAAAFGSHGARRQWRAKRSQVSHAHRAADQPDPHRCAQNLPQDRRAMCMADGSSAAGEADTGSVHLQSARVWACTRTPWL